METLTLLSSLCRGYVLPLSYIHKLGRSGFTFTCPVQPGSVWGLVWGFLLGVLVGVPLGGSVWGLEFRLGVPQESQESKNPHQESLGGCLPRCFCRTPSAFCRPCFLRDFSIGGIIALWFIPQVQ